VANLTSADWLILLIYFFFALSIGLTLKGTVKTSRDYLQAGRSLPAWICGLAFVSVSLGAQQLLGMGASGAQYGFRAIQFFSLGAIPGMLFAGLFLMPLYYGSNARTVPEFLGLRFGKSTRVVSACVLLATAVLSAGAALYAMARIFAALHVFDSLFYAHGLQPANIVPVTLLAAAALVLVYVLLGGLAAALYNQVLQFFVMAAALLPVVLLGLRGSGWSAIKSAAASAAERGPGHAGFGGFVLAALLGFVLSTSYWCTDFRVLQTAMAAKDAESARKAPLIAAAVWLLVPVLLVLPGPIALALPTPHTTEFVRSENGTIYHEIDVAPPADEAGQGAVPAVLDPATGKPLRAAGGTNLLDYTMATPNLLLHFLPGGLLGLGIAALLAGLMSGAAAAITAIHAVFTCDLYQPFIRRNASDGHYLAVARWTAVGAALLALGACGAALRFGWKLESLAMFCAVLSAPLLATVLLGMFWKRATAPGAFAGLAAGIATAGLPAVLGRFASGPRFSWVAWMSSGPARPVDVCLTILAALGLNFVVAFAVSLRTTAQPEAELAGLMHSLAPRPARAPSPWWKRPEALAAAILITAVAINLLFV